MDDYMSQSYHDVMEVYKRPMSVRFIPRIFSWLLVFGLLFGVSQTAYAMDKEPVIWVQVPQWTDDWAVCAVDIPDAACHWYVANADNTFCLLYTSPSPRDISGSRMPSSA